MKIGASYISPWIQLDTRPAAIAAVNAYRGETALETGRRSFRWTGTLRL